MATNSISTQGYTNKAYDHNEQDVDPDDVRLNESLKFTNASNDQQSKRNKWDIFQESPESYSSIKTNGTWKTLEKILTIVFSSILCAVVLVAGVTSRVTLHILVWHLNPPTNVNNVIQGNVTVVTSPVDEGWIWSIFIVIISPYVFTLIATGKTICMKRTRTLHYKSLFVVLLVESLHSIGLCCLVYIVLPTFNPPIASIVLLAVLFVLPLLDISNFCLGSKSIVKLIFAICGLLLQIVGIGMVCFYTYKCRLIEQNTTITVLFIVSAILVSFKYWETFVDAKHDTRSPHFVKWIYQTRRTRMSFVIHVWKTILTFTSVLVIFSVKSENARGGIEAIFNSGSIRMKNIFGSHVLGANDKCESYVPYLVAVINIVSSYICAKSAKTACIIKCQKVSFSLPLCVVPIASVIVLGAMHFYPNVQIGSCMMYFKEGDLEKIDDIEIIWPMIMAGVALICSLIFSTSHIWMTNGYLLGRTQRMFVEPLYCGINSDISLLLNRRRNDDEYDKIVEQERKVFRERLPEIDKTNSSSVDETHQRSTQENGDGECKSQIYACATMWHETETEMTQLLTSIFRMDKHQKILETAEKLKEGNQKPCKSYDFEAHIFFDDAFDPPKEDTKHSEVNEYVKSFMGVIDKAARVVHKRWVKLGDSYQMEATAYGGRITWTMPGRNKLVAHLKDKTKIRHKKRWSQVMYMYYFLGYRLHGNSNQTYKDLSKTYILALDGDVDFQPEAVMHLLQRMTKDPFVGAACGRIHPIGSGPLIWYQQFEYAVSHWLQKATEHVIGGCVLCSPGCFSLFRGSALIGVLKTYTQIPTEANQFIQFDQGEDRWLCTLLLKQGNKVLYCAESDALTFAPEGFFEFFNQRRRWIPSTMANIMDILGDWRRVVKINQNFSTIYTMYQMFLFISSLLTPGTIFLMILGAIIVGFPSVPAWLALTLNVVPVGLFMLSCFVTKSETQLQFAVFLSSVYALVMMIVLVGILKEAVEEGFCSTTTIFLCFVAGVFIISAILHPQEGSCLIHGILYFISVPAMQMLLLLYSLGNLHVVSWGTREVKTAASQGDKGSDNSKAVDTGYTLSIGRILRCVWCPKAGKRSPEYLDILNKLEAIERQISNTQNIAVSKSTTEITEKTENRRNSHNDIQGEHKTTHKQEDSAPNTTEEDLRKRKAICNFEQADELDENEQQFWKDLINKYLQPLEKNAQKEKKAQQDLIDLRNKCCLFFFLINALLVTVIYALTHSDAFNNSLSIYFSCNSKDVPIEPISITFTVVFGILLLIQFFCLLFHRMTTLIHITATTSIRAEINEDKQFEKVIEILQRSNSMDSKISVMTDDNAYVFETTERRRIKRMTDVTGNKNKSFDLDKVMEDKLNGINTIVGLDTAEGDEGVDSFMDKTLEQFGPLTAEEQEIMRKFITDKKYVLLLKKIQNEERKSESKTKTCYS